MSEVETMNESPASDASTGDEAAAPDREVLVSVNGLKKHFPITEGLFRRQVGAVRAVDDVSFDIYRGETLGLVGESGSGKSTTGRAVLQLDPVTDGTVHFDGNELTAMRSSEVRKLRPRMQMVFQNPTPPSTPG